MCALLLSRCALSQDDLSLREQQAFQRAAEQVAQSVVRIETIGGLDRVGKTLTASAATTGVVVGSDGEIITSAFNFVGRPSSVLVTLPGGQRMPARVISTDHNRMLTLLKVDVNEPLVVPPAAPHDELRVGQWGIAVGRTFDATRPNISVGIVSGLNRVWGKAIQTDAKISPANYGGPLLDIEGRVMGILAPLSPDATGEMAGFEWYDSGIGFAIPFEHIQRMLPRLREADLHPGILGVNLKPGSTFGEPAVVLGVRPNSPAAKAGFQAADQIVEIDGQPVERQVQMRSLMIPRYAGDTVQFVVLRGEERIAIEAELVAELQPYQHPFLGILPMRASDDGAGITVRSVYDDSPAALAGIRPGDVVTHLAGQQIGSVDQAWQVLSAFGPSAAIAVTYRRGEEQQQREVVLTSIPESVPSELPPAYEQLAEVEVRQGVGRVQIKLPEFANDCLAYVPASYGQGVPQGLVLWLHGAGGYEADALVERWKPICDEFGLILVAPKAAEPAAWQPTELDFVKRALGHVSDQYGVDRARIVAAGEQAGAVLAYVMAFQAREQIRGVVAINGAAAGRLGENEPLQRLAFYVADSEQSRFRQQSLATIEKLRDMKYPVTIRERAEDRSLSADELQEVGRWIDSLDRI